jgi:hypothetical protein
MWARITKPSGMETYTSGVKGERVFIPLLVVTEPVESHLNLCF